MISRATGSFWKAYRELPAPVRARARKVYALWLHDPRHPSLHFKKVHPGRPIYSVRIGIEWRAVCVKHENRFIRFWIGSHSDYETLLSQV